MNKREMKRLQKVVATRVGVPSVEFVSLKKISVPANTDSFDMKMLELENKTNMLRAQSVSLRERRQEKKLLSSQRMWDGLDKLDEKIINTIDSLGKKVKNAKITTGIKYYFFPELEDEEVMYDIDGYYEHQMDDAVEEGNVTYLSRDFKNLK